MTEQVTTSTVSSARKRPNKAESVIVLRNYYATLVVTGIMNAQQYVALIGSQRQKGTDHFVYERELEGISEKESLYKDPTFLALLKAADCIIPSAEGSTGGSTGGNFIPVDSIERAREVTKDEADAIKVSGLLKQIKALAAQAKPFLVNASISLAVKNEKPKPAKTETTGDAPDGADIDEADIDEDTQA